MEQLNTPHIKMLLDMAAQYMDEDSSLAPDAAFKKAIEREGELLNNLLSTTHQTTLNSIGWADGDKSYHPNLSFELQPYQEVIRTLGREVYNRAK